VRTLSKHILTLNFGVWISGFVGFSGATKQKKKVKKETIYANCICAKQCLTCAKKTKKKKKGFFEATTILHGEVPASV